MTKMKFLMSLHDRLSGLPRDDVEERLLFYSEMIEDRMEEGLSEEEAVAAIGTVDEIADQIISETPLMKLAKRKIKPKRRLRTWEIVLLAVGSPIWLSLLIAAFAVILSLYVSLWSVIVSLWACFSLAVSCAFGSVAVGIGVALCGNAPVGLPMLAAGLVWVGLSIFLFWGCRAASNGIVRLTGWLACTIKKCLVGRGMRNE